MKHLESVKPARTSAQSLQPLCFGALIAFALLSTYPWLNVAGIELRVITFVATIVAALALTQPRSIVVGRPAMLLAGLSVVALASFVASHLFAGPGYYDDGDIIRFVRLLAVGAVGYLAVHAMGTKIRRHLWWVGAAALGLYLLAIALPLIVAGVNPVSLTYQSLRQSDIWLVVDGIYGAAAQEVGATSNGVDISPTFRHELMRGLLVPAVLSFLTIGPLARWQRRVRLVSAILIAAIVVLSYSRSGILTLGLIAVVPLGAALRSGKLSKREWQGLAAAGSAVVAGLLAFGDLIIDRITDSDGGSLETRGNAIEVALNSIPGEWLFGTGERFAGKFVRSPHMMPLDWWLGGGLVGGLTAIAFVATLLYLAYQAMHRQSGSERGGEARQQHWAVAALFLVVAVGAMTEGGGRMTTSLWLVLGMTLAFSERTTVDVGSG